MINRSILLEVFEADPRSIQQLSRITRIDQGRLLSIMRGEAIAQRWERAKIAQLFGKAEDELFGNVAARPAVIDTASGNDLT